jgi:phosphopantothenoylcysteine decarboxylase/phosphopantothenate--cysteine ligase
MNIIITAGATIESIDDVRFITNMSTGKTASVISDKLSKKNKITYLCSKTVKFLPEKNKNVNFIEFSDFKSLNNFLKKELKKKYDAVIHCAAVSDFSVKKIEINDKEYKAPFNGKIKSDCYGITLVLYKNFKIIRRLKYYSKNIKIFIIGFKLTSKADEKKRKIMISEINADMVVHNDTEDISADKHIFNIYSKNKKIYSVKNERELASVLLEVL